MVNFDPQNICLFVAQGCWERLHRHAIRQGFDSPAPKERFRAIKEYLKNYKVSDFEFINYCNADLNSLNELCSLIIKDKLALEWSASAILDSKMDCATIDNMAKAGCKKLFFDVFSLPQPLLKQMKIDFNPEAASRILGRCRQTGISVGINLFFGHPRESQEDFDNTVDFLARNIGRVSEISRLSYCPSSYIYADSLEASLCRYWIQCLASDKNHIASFTKKRFQDCLLEIFNLGKPIVKIEPNEAILSSLLSSRIDQLTVPPYAISRKRIKIAYAEGGLQFFWNNIKVTSHVGLNMALNTLGLWIDSTRGDWHILEMDKDYLSARIFFGNLPATQNWKIKITGEYKASWTVDIEVQRRLRIEEIRLVCLLDPRYLNWFNDYQQSEFPKLDNHWHDLWEEELPVSLVGVRPVLDELPLFVLEVKNKNIFSLVQNPPAETKSRIIGFKCRDLEGRKDYAPGRYRLLEGQVNFFAPV